MNYDKPLTGNGLVLVKQIFLDWLAKKQDVVKGKSGQVAGFDSSGNLVAQDFTGGGGDSIPSGVIVMWNGSANQVPDGWHICDGKDGTPDLQDKFVLSAGSTYKPKDVGGNSKITLTANQLAPHSHPMQTQFGGPAWINTSTNNTKYALQAIAGTNSIVDGMIREFPEKEAEPIDIMPPYYALCYIMKM